MIRLIICIFELYFDNNLTVCKYNSFISKQVIITDYEYAKYLNNKCINYKMTNNIYNISSSCYYAYLVENHQLTSFVLDYIFTLFTDNIKLTNDSYYT